jgi:hypothetical protein
MSKLLGIGLRIKGDFSNLMQPHRHIIRMIMLYSEPSISILIDMII